MGQPPAAANRPAGVLDYFSRHPRGFWFIFWGELAERSSYYGMRAILATYMAEQLGLGKSNAATYMSFFMAACYFLPLLGGYLADNFFGKYWTIVAFSAPYILGQFLVGIENKYCLIIALTLLAMGSGVIKPNISTLMGMTYDQERPGDVKLRSDAFSMFYFAVNVGAAISQFAMPPLRTNYGYAAAFMFPAALMVVAFILFAAGKKYYAVQVIEKHEITPEDKAERRRVLLRVCGLFGLCMFFWAIFDQSATTWIFFAKNFMDCRIFGQEIDPESVQAFNSVFILVFLPLVTIGFRMLDNRGIKVRATDKMVVGFLLTAATMGVMALAGVLSGPVQSRMEVLKDGTSELVLFALPENRVSVWWQILAYLVLTIAEILISVTGLELGYTAAPKSMTGFVTGCWLFTIGMANLFINAPVTRLYSGMNPAVYFGGLAVTLLVVTVAFTFVAKRFNRPDDVPNV